MIRILIVEDEMIIADILSEQLKALGYEIVDIVASGEAAIECARGHRIDLILMDILLCGRLDGIQTVEILSRTQTIPVIFTTAYSDITTLTRAKLTQPWGYLVKPYKVDDIHTTIEIVWEKFQHIQNHLDTNERHQQQQAQFFSESIHEFRTPMNVVLSAAELLKLYSEQLDKTKVAKCHRRIRDAVMQMKGILDDLLQLGAMDSGKLVANPQPLALEPFCWQIVAGLPLELERPAVNLTLDLQVSEPLLDSKLLQHILGNLLANALKYSPSHTPIALSVRTTAESVCFEVSDRGIGIPPEDISHLCDAYYRASNVGQMPGTGLGLSVVRRCAELHSGKLEVDSQVGEGTTFRVWIPQKIKAQSKLPDLLNSSFKLEDESKYIDC